MHYHLRRAIAIAMLLLEVLSQHPLKLYMLPDTIKLLSLNVFTITVILFLCSDVFYSVDEFLRNEQKILCSYC